MKRIQKRKHMLTGIMGLIAALFLGGCGISANSQDRELTREAYIGMLGDRFGYNSYISEEDRFADVPSSNTYYSEIQSASEWGIIEESGDFHPNEPASIGFALETAVRAVGIDSVAASGTQVEESDLVNFYVNHIAAIEVADPNAAISIETAEQILEYAKEYRNNLVLPQVVEYQFTEAVKEADPSMVLSPNGDVVTLASGDASQYQVGDILYFENMTDDFPRFMKITGASGNSFTVDDATLDETYESIDISGTFEGRLLGATTASDGTVAGFGDELYDEMHAYGMSMRDTEKGDYMLLSNAVNVDGELDTGSDHITFNSSFSVKDTTNPRNKASGNFKVGVTNVRFNFDFHKTKILFAEIPTGIKLDAHWNKIISAHVEGHMGTSIPIGDAYFQIGTTPFVARIALTANLGADGSIDINYEDVNILNAGAGIGTGIYKTFESRPVTKTLEADVTLTAEATVLADIRFGADRASESIINAQVTSGVVAVAEVDVDLLGEQPACADVKMYVPLRWGLNQERCVVTDWLGDKGKYSATIWDQSSSPVNLHFHFEDGARTPGDICTRKEAVEEEMPLDLDEPLEYILFDFKKLDFDFIELERNAVYLQPGDSMKVPILSVPDEYTTGDLVYEVKDSSVCTVSGGMIIAGEAGSTLVKISTSDGVFTATLAVTVNDDYTVEGFQVL